MQDIKQWLVEIGLDKYVQQFHDNAIDSEVIDELTEDDLRELGLTLGARKRFLKALPFKKAQQARVTAPANEGERRQITVVFCDLVDSTPLAEQVDPEELRALIESFQAVCVQVVEQHGGYIARYLGDGILIYFGYPRAREGDAVLATYAALDIIKQINQRVDLNIEIHIGIHTGLVVAGDTREEKDAIFGDTPNIAARVEGEAGAGEIMLSPSTKSLVEHYIVTESIGSRKLKGLSKPMELYKAIKRKTIHGSSTQRSSNDQLPGLIGRETEKQLLLDKWQETQTGKSQIVAITAEPGVGKTLLLNSVAADLVGEYTRINYFCSAFHQNSAFFPVTSQLESALQLDLANNEQESRSRITEFVKQLDLQSDVGLMLEQLFGLQPVPKSDSQQFKNNVLNGLADILCAMAERRPVFLAAEDVHWVDPSTSEVLHGLIDRVQHSRILVVITLRPEAAEQWTDESRTEVIRLSALDGKESVKLVESLIQHSGINQQLAKQIAEQADGVPLFLEELTKSALSNEQQKAADKNRLAVPLSLKDALMSRLDNMGKEREIAQIASIIGRRFDAKIVAAIAGGQEDEVGSSLKSLADSDILRSLDSQANEQIYEFRHALIRDLAYESLLQSRRRQLHKKIADLLADDSNTRVAPELLAWHFEHAGEVENAINFYQQAAQASLQLFAHSEAVQNLRHAIDLLLTQPKSAARDDRELQLRLLLGPSLMTLGGYASKEVIENYLLARQIYEDYEDRSKLFLVLHGLYEFQMVGGNLPGGQMLAEEMLAIGNEQQNPLQILVGKASLGTICILQGKVSTSFEHTSAGIAKIEQVSDKTVFAEFGHDHRVTLRLYNAWAHTILGRLPQARTVLMEAMQLAEQIKQPSSLGFSLCYTAQVLNLAGFYKEAREYIDRARELCNTHQIPLWDALSQIQLGWNELMQGDVSAGKEIGERGIDCWLATGARSGATFFHASLAEGLLMQGEHKQAANHLDAARQFCEETGELFQHAEILRLRALLQAEVKNQLADLKQARDMAKQDAARLVELKIVTGLQQLKPSQEHEAELRRILTDFSGAEQSAHVQRAYQVLDQ